MHCNIIRTGIHKGNPLVPFVESGDVIVLKALFAKSSARTGRFGNPIGRVSDGSFPYFCPYRNRVPARQERKKTLFLKKERRIATHLTHSCGAQKLLFAWSANNF